MRLGEQSLLTGAGNTESAQDAPESTFASMAGRQQQDGEIVALSAVASLSEGMKA